MKKDKQQLPKLMTADYNRRNSPAPANRGSLTPHRCAGIMPLLSGDKSKGSENLSGLEKRE